MTTEGNGKRARDSWRITKEKILMISGLTIIGYESILAGFFGQMFHFEILIAGCALCGISLSQWGDKQ